MDDIFKEIIEFTQWKDEHFSMYKDKTYYIKSSSPYFDATKYTGPTPKPTKYYTVEKLYKQFKKETNEQKNAKLN